MTNEGIIKGLQATNEHIGKHFNEDGAWMAEFIDNAIKELETVSCIKEKCAYCPHCENCDVDDETLEIKSFESQRWIPVSERLPEEGTTVLVWYRYWRYGEYNNWYYTYGIGYQFDEYWSVIDGGTRTTVYAWQELPQPYKAESEEKE